MTIIVGSRKQSCLITTNNKNLIIELYCYETINIINFNFFCLLFLFQLSHKKHEKNQWKCYVL